MFFYPFSFSLASFYSLFPPQSHGMGQVFSDLLAGFQRNRYICRPYHCFTLKDENTIEPTLYIVDRECYRSPRRAVLGRVFRQDWSA